MATAESLAQSRAEELAALQSQLEDGSAASSDLVAQNATLREDARLAREQAAALSQEITTLRTRVAISQPPVRTPPPGRSAPSRPSAANQPRVVFPSAARSMADNTSTPARTNPATLEMVQNEADGPRRHTIMPGETLSAISRDFYGTPNRWPEILEANRDVIPNPNALRVGTPIVIP